MRSNFNRVLAAGTAAALAFTGTTLFAPTARAAAEPDPTKAANYLVANLPKAKDGAAASITAALGLATMNDCTYAPAVRTLTKQIERTSTPYLYPRKQLNPARAANLAVAVQALGRNPRKFAGRNLISLVTRGLPKDGRIGATDSAFSQSLAIVALNRSKATIPVTLLTKLLSQQGPAGAFGYEWPVGTFNADPDSTALGVLSLQAIGQLKPQLDAATGWATANQTPAGNWPSFSSVDSTALLGAALKAAGQDVTKARQWLGTVQLPDGGFPNSLDAGIPSERTATANALWLITGKSLLDVEFKVAKCGKSSPRVPAVVVGVQLPPTVIK